MSFELNDIKLIKTTTEVKLKSKIRDKAYKNNWTNTHEDSQKTNKQSNRN